MRKSRATTDRPVSVTVANLALLVAATGLATDSVIGLVLAERVTAAVQEAYRGEADFSVVNIQTTGIILLVAAGGLVLLAGLNQRGSRAARINTWVLGLLVLCWGSFTSLGGQSPTPRNAPDPAEYERLLAEAMPNWVEPVTVGTVLVSMLGVAVAMLLLVLPGANEFYRHAHPPRLSAADLPID